MSHEQILVQSHLEPQNFRQVVLFNETINDILYAYSHSLCKRYPN